MAGNYTLRAILVTMERFTGQQRAFCVKQFYKNNDSYVTVRRLFRIEYGLRRVCECPSVNLIKTWVQKFELTGSITNIKQTRSRSRTFKRLKFLHETIKNHA